MLVKKVAFGDYDEAYIESRISDSVNIIFSTENNKGKTLLIQGLMYSLGNSPVFPADFDYKNCFFFSEVEIENINYEFLRKNNSITVKFSDELFTFDSISDFKYFVNKRIFPLPKIKKNEMEHIVEPSLLFQIFFVGQDDRKTSNIQNNGQYNKNDFISMLNILNGVQEQYLDGFDLEDIKREIKEKKTKISEIKKKITLLPDDPKIAAQLLEHSNQDEVKIKLKNIKKINDTISELNRDRFGEINRKVKLDNLIIELNSLNRSISSGELVCADCGCKKIIFSNKDINFDLSNDTVRKHILKSIREQINIKIDKIAELSEYLSKAQAKYASIIRDTPVDVKTLMIFSDDLIPNEPFSQQISKLQAEIDELNASIKSDNRLKKEDSEKNKLMISTLLTNMNKLYKEIDPAGDSYFNNLFSKVGATYSGSQGQEFHFCKLLSINNYFKHTFPIIMDSFRSGEISSSKEIKMIKHYLKLNKQVILTATLKPEESNILKYDTIKGVKAINYESHKEKHILSNIYIKKFNEILSRFNIVRET